MDRWKRKVVPIGGLFNQGQNPNPRFEDRTRHCAFQSRGHCKVQRRQIPWCTWIRCQWFRNLENHANQSNSVSTRLNLTVQQKLVISASNKPLPLWNPTKFFNSNCTNIPIPIYFKWQCVINLYLYIPYFKMIPISKPCLKFHTQ